MLVMEKRKDIAILKSLGASNSGIGFSFVITGGVAGFIGTIIGVSLGILLSLNINSIITFIEKIINTFTKLLYYIRDGKNYVPISLLDPAYYLETIPVTIPWKEVGIIALGTIVLSILVSIIPASKAAKEKPLNIIRIWEKNVNIFYKIMCDLDFDQLINDAVIFIQEIRGTEKRNKRLCMECASKRGIPTHNLDGSINPEKLSLEKSKRDYEKLVFRCASWKSIME